MSEPLTKEQARECYIRDGWKCRHCRTREGLHLHHMVYKSAGGPNDLWNLLTLCWNCHRQHHDGFLKIAWGTLSGNGPVEFTREKGYRV